MNKNMIFSKKSNNSNHNQDLINFNESGRISLRNHVSLTNSNNPTVPIRETGITFGIPSSNTSKNSYPLKQSIQFDFDKD